MVLPLLSVSNDIWTAIGTTFVLHASEREALLVTAAHNLTHFLPRGRHHPSTPVEFQTPPSRLTHVDDQSLGVLVFEIDHFALAAVVSAYLHSDWDLALLRARLPREAPVRFTRHIALDSKPLTPSCVVHVAGYARMNVEHATDNERADFDLPLLVRAATVTEVDAMNVRRGPTAQVSCGIDSGMSGGPVFDMRGTRPHVRAVARSDLSDSVTDMSRGTGVIARVTLIEPVLGFPVPPTGSNEAVATAATEKIAGLIARGEIIDAR